MALRNTHRTLIKWKGLCLVILSLTTVSILYGLFSKTEMSVLPDSSRGVTLYLRDVSANETYLDRSEAERLYKKVRIACLILTMDKDFDLKAKTVEKTWAKRCNKYYFIAKTDRQGSHIIRSNFPEKRKNLFDKVKQGLRYIYDNNKDEIDWVFKADDDTYAIIENMRFLLSHYDSSEPGYLGYHFNRYVYNGYMSGGAGYVISRAGLGRLIEKGLNPKTALCKSNLKNKALSDNDEDANIGYCLNQTGVPVLSSMDIFGRESFHPVQLEKYLKDDIPKYLYDWPMTKARTGMGCCSRFPITFHYMTPDAMILMDHLLYWTSVYGQTVVNNPKDVFRIGPVKHKPHAP